jgi:AraC-like DNA-binding protein
VRRRKIARLEGILGWLRGSYTERVGLADIARRFSMNPSYFYDYFRRSLGVTFHDYLARLRVEEAVRLIGEDTASTTDIPYACGFDSPASFYRAFRRVTGESPGDCRRRLSGSGGEG